MPRKIQGLLAARVGIGRNDSFRDKLMQEAHRAILHAAQQSGNCITAKEEELTGLEPQGVPYTIDFSTQLTPQAVDLSTAQWKNQLGNIKTVFIDNSANTANLILTCEGTYQQIVIPAGGQGFVPVASTLDKFKLETTTTVLVGFVFFNIDISGCVWIANPANATPIPISPFIIPANGGTDYSVNKPALGTLLTTIPAGLRNFARVQNQSAEQIQCQLDNGSIILLEPNGGDDIGGGADTWTGAYNGRIRIYGTAGAAVNAYTY